MKDDYLKYQGMERTEWLASQRVCRNAEHYQGGRRLDLSSDSQSRRFYERRS